MSQRRTKMDNVRRQSRSTSGQSSRSRSSRLTFAELIDVLEPDGPFPESEASAWKSIIDRNEQLIIFYQVDYIQASPNISKCVRIRRHRSDTNVDKLIPTVFVNQQLQSTYVKDLLGRKHLDSHDDLTTILDHLQDEQGRVGVSANDGFGSDGDDDGSDDEEDTIPKGSVRLPSILPSALTSDASSYLPGYGEGIDVVQEVEYRLLPPKWEEDGQEEVLSEIPPEGSGSEGYLPASKRARKSSASIARKRPAESDTDTTFSPTYSADTNPNQNISAALKLLPCSKPGPGKVPLIPPPYTGTQLYVCAVKYPQLQQRNIQDKSKYLRALFKLLTGENGVADLLRHRVEYMQQHNVESYGAVTQLGTDFMDTVKCHLHQKGITDTSFLGALLGCILHDRRRCGTRRTTSRKTDQVDS